MTKRKSPPRLPYYVFSATESSTRHRMIVQADVDIHYKWRFEDGLFVPPPGVPIPARVIKLRKRIEDMPWCGEARLVSDRLRRLLLRFEPDTLDFVGVVTTLDGKPWPDGPHYFMINTRKIVECHDLQRSRINIDARGKPYFREFMFDPSRPDPNDHLFRAKGYEVEWIVSDAVRQAMDAEGMTGCCFFDPAPLKPLW